MFKSYFLKNKKRNNKGFTLVETLVAVSVFIIISLSAYQAYIGLLKAVQLSRIKLAASNLANEQFEIVRNMPYSDVGISGGLPSGVIPYTQNLTRDTHNFTVTATVRNIDQPFDGTIGGDPNDLSPADNKLVEFIISCATCTNFNPTSFTSVVAPKNLETASTNGALFVRVFDANGVAIQGASVHIENNVLVPAVSINETTNSQGMLQIVDVPPANVSYEIHVTKDGYSSDYTLPPTVANPNPAKPHSTVVLQQVTQTSFAIDKTSTFNFSSRTMNCNAVPQVSFDLSGSKLIGSEPDVLKFEESFETNNSGLLPLQGMEWDSYDLIMTDADYDLIGTNPLLPLSLNPDSVFDAQIIVAPKDPRTLLVTVKDNGVLLPVADVSVELSKAGFSETLTTGRGFVNQTDWSGGGGQQLYTNTSEYWIGDGGLDTTTLVGDVILTENFGSYTSAGYLESSVLDTGSVSTFYNISISPQDQPPLAGSNSVRIQLASGNDAATTTWDFKGPDGTAGTYYTLSDLNIGSFHNNDRYMKYKLLLSTEDDSVSPQVSDVAITYTSACIPPGQVAFQGLSSGDYTLELSRAGYDTQQITITMDALWKKQDVLLIPTP
ncbi:MAG: hypothetical protein RJA61_73 [Candidatus Parcubacteria bacterium]|jgi:type II secretory pathway pseudopilin PulG